MLQQRIAIVGAGTVGCALAISLAQAGFEVTLIDAASTGEEPQGSGFDSRSIALSYGSFGILNGLPIGDELQRICTPIKDIQVSDQGHLGQTLLGHDELAVPALGYVVELHKLGQCMHRHMQSNAKINWLRGCKVTDVMQTVGEVNLAMSDGTCVNADLVVAADGGMSSVKQLMALESTTESYPQAAVIANVGIQNGHGGMAFERFTSSGPLAMLPMSEVDGQARCSLVWCVPSLQRDTVMAWSDEQFLEQLQHAFGFRLGKLTQVGERMSYPLALTYNDFPQQHRVLFIGNASQTIHPIAGQGFNLAMRDVNELVTQLTSARDQHLDIGSTRVLYGYSDSRKQDRQSVISRTDSLVRLFSNQHVPMVMGRNIGLLGLQCLSPLKQGFAKTMMGL